MPERCPECGAILPEGATCQSIFESFLALEYSDPAYYEAHFAMVSCFMIQHGRYSDEGLAWIKPVLRAYLDQGLSQAALRQLAAKDTSSTTRTWKITRRPGDPPQPKINWSMTIADVARNCKDPESYIRLVNQWSETTSREAEALR
jgi:hypothetical protein